MRQDDPAPGPPGPPLKIAVGGTAALVDAALVPALRAAGHEVLRIVREKPKRPEAEVFWNQHEMQIDAARLEGLDAVIHLPGEDVLSMRWSEQRKMQIYASRVRGTELLAKTLAQLDAPPRVFVSASSIAYYGSRGDEVLTEASEPGQRGFLAAVAQDWEAATGPAADAGIRTVRVRLGVVLDPSDRPLEAMLIPFRLGLGGRYGPKDRYLSWIARDDVVHALGHLLVTEGLEGPFNLTSPQPVTMERFTRTLARVLRRPALLSIPGAVFRLLYGEVADETVLQSARVYPGRLLATGYDFAYPDIEAALRHLLRKPSKGEG